jgi:hypothetical protein
MKFYILIFLKNLWRKCRFNLNVAKIMGALHDDQDSVLIISVSYFFLE